MSKIKLNTNVIYTFSNSDINFAIVSDIHEDGKEMRPAQYKDLCLLLEKIEPDYILVPGDTMQSKSASIKNINNLVKNLGSIAPTILSVGNHEQETVEEGIPLDWFHNLEKYPHIYPLDNKSVVLNNIQFTGFNPKLEVYLTKKKNRIDAFIENFKKAKLTPSKYTDWNIMLTHNPLFITRETLEKEPTLKDYDLFISGHTHNGCTPSFMEPFLGHHGLLGPYFTLFPKNCRNITDIEKSKVFVSKGFRKFVTPEIKALYIMDNIYPKDVHQLVLKRK